MSETLVVEDGDGKQRCPIPFTSSGVDRDQARSK